MRSRQWMQVLLALAVASLSSAQLTTVPDLATATQTTATTSATSATTSATSATTGTTTAATTGTTTSAATTSTSTGSTSFPSLVSSNPTATSTSQITTTSGGSTFVLGSGFPTIAGAGIPTMIVPYTAGAPFMQHSDLPQGTVFIGVGAVLAFLGAAVLLWRGLIAWSINRSVKRAALASIRSGAEKPVKNWGTGSGYNPAKGGLYKDVGGSVSMEALTPTGRNLKSHTFKEHDSHRNSLPPASGLFFSPTAHAQSRNSTAPAVFNNDVAGNRNSAYLPAGYYAQPSSHAAGGARSTTIGGPVPPYARHSGYEHTPPDSPAMRPHSTVIGPRASHDTLRLPQSRDGGRNTIYNQPSNSSLNANIGGPRPGSAGLAGQRAPSAYLEDLFENSTAMASRDHL